MGRGIPVSEMDDSAVESITERLSGVTDLHMPQSFARRSEPVSNSEKKLHLSSLLRRDAAVFLERYGSRLTLTELEKFQVLQADYEIGWHLKQLRSAASPTAEEQRVRATAVKNRRLAYMSRLVQDGHYFSEDEMRLRSPLLHHQYVGKFQDASTRGAVRPGERFSEHLLRRVEEVYIQRRLQEEMEEAGIVEMEREQEEEEEDDDISEHEEEEEEEEDEKNQEEEVKEDSDAEDVSMAQADEADEAGSSASAAGDAHNTDSSLEMVVSDDSLEERMNDFTRVMQEKFLSGEDDEHVNYSSIDNDHTLDDHWLVEMSRDAEEKYFEQD